MRVANSLAAAGLALFACKDERKPIEAPPPVQIVMPKPSVAAPRRQHPRAAAGTSAKLTQALTDCQRAPALSLAGHAIITTHHGPAPEMTNVYFGAKKLSGCRIVERFERNDPPARGWKIVLSGSEAERERSIAVETPDGWRPDVSAGTHVSIEVTERFEQIHRIVEGHLSGADGIVLLGHSEGKHGAIPTFALGFGKPRGTVPAGGPPPRPAKGFATAVEVSHRGQTFEVFGNESVEFGDSVYAFNASGHRWTKGVRPPDSSTYFSATLVKVTHD